MPDTTDRVLAFIDARLDEEEQAAREASSERRGRVWTARPSPYHEGVEITPVHPDFGRPIKPDIGTVEVNAGRHIVRQDPLTTLTRSAALRTLIALHQRVKDWGRYLCQVCHRAGDEEEGYWPCDTVCRVAAIWAGHPDYPTDLRERIILINHRLAITALRKQSTQQPQQGADGGDGEP